MYPYYHVVSYHPLYPFSRTSLRESAAFAFFAYRIVLLLALPRARPILAFSSPESQDVDHEKVVKVNVIVLGCRQ